MQTAVHAADLAFFSTLIAAGSLSAAGRELGISTAAVSKRLGLMEARLGLALVNRTTRRMSVTPEGEIYLDYARRILAELDDLQQILGAGRESPSGLLRVNATLGFGRSHIGPLISQFSFAYPQVKVQLQLSVDPPALTADSFDVCVRFGAPPESRMIARKLAHNKRILCASPAYLERHGTPTTPTQLNDHNCIGIRQGEDAYGVWRLSETACNGDILAESVRVRGNLTTNDGEIAVRWALDGHGILIRAQWDIQRYLKEGRLVQVLSQYATPDADIYAVYPEHHRSATRVKAFVDFLAGHLKSGPLKS